MKVNINEKTILVGWRYENPELDQLLKVCGIDEKEIRDLNEPKLIELINKKLEEANKEHGLNNEYIICLPKPHTTHCILRDEEGQILYASKVSKHRKDPFNKDKARRYSLSKALLGYYPHDEDNHSKTQENKLIRRKFWEAYINRGGKLVEMKVVSRQPLAE